MKNFLLFVVLLVAALVPFGAKAENLPTDIYDKIAADALRDPYAESPNKPIALKKKAVQQEEIIAPEAAEFMKPNKLLKQDNGNLRIKFD